MASVKYAISDYIADGTTTDYLITWDYLDEDHIAVYVDGTSNADPSASHTFTQLNDTTVRVTDELGNAITAGSEIEIRRETPLTTRAITFADGSALLASDLNKNSDYLLYSMQEVLDTVDAAAQDGALAAQVATEGYRDQAEIYKNDAETAKNTTQTYLATVQSDATDADNHRIASAASEAAAATSEANAATSETNSANSATASANSATASAASAAASLASEQASAASETAAAASETAAAASETAAAASEAAAATSEANAAASFDNFDDRYLGAKSTAPTVDNDGDALLVGALYWNDVSDTMFAWNGTAWDTLNSTTGLADSSTSAQIAITDTSTTVQNNLIIQGDTSFVGDVITDIVVGNLTVKSDRINLPAITATTGSAGDLVYDSTEGALKVHDGTQFTSISGTILGEESYAPFTNLAELSGQNTNTDKTLWYKPYSGQTEYKVLVNFNSNGDAKFKTTLSGAETTLIDGSADGCSQGSYNFWQALRACLLRGKRLCNNGETVQNGTGCSHDSRYIWMNYRSGTNYQLYNYSGGPSPVYANPDNAYNSDIGIRCCSDNVGQLWVLN